MSGLSYEKSCQFAINVVRTYQRLCDEKREFILSKQFVRSGTSIGANLAEAENAISKKDFLNKQYIALKECVETLYWLNLLHDTQYLSDDQYVKLKDDCTEIKKMLSSSTKTVKESLAGKG